MSLIYVKFEIQGAVPLLQNNPDGPSKAAANPERQYGAKPDDEWRLKTYDTGSGLGHPSCAFKQGLMEAGRTMPGRKKTENMKFPIKHSVFMEGQWLTFTNRKEPDGPYTNCPRPASTGQRLTNIIPMFDTGWRLQGSFRFDDDVITIDRIKSLMDRFGDRFGLGVHRPDFGRFIVNSFDTSKNNGNGKKK